MKKHEPKNKKHYARSQLATRRRDDMMHGQGVSSLRLGTLGARPPPSPHQASAKEIKMENHKRSASAHSADFCTWRCHGMMHGQGVRSLRLSTLGPWPHSPPHQASTKESKMEKHKSKMEEHPPSAMVSLRDHTLCSLLCYS